MKGSESGRFPGINNIISLKAKDVYEKHTTTFAEIHRIENKTSYVVIYNYR